MLTSPVIVLDLKNEANFTWGSEWCNKTLSGWSIALIAVSFGKYISLRHKFKKILDIFSRTGRGKFESARRFTKRFTIPQSIIRSLLSWYSRREIAPWSKAEAIDESAISIITIYNYYKFKDLRRAETASSATFWCADFNISIKSGIHPCGTSSTRLQWHVQISVTSFAILTWRDGLKGGKVLLKANSYYFTQFQRNIKL